MIMRLKMLRNECGMDLKLCKNNDDLIIPVSDLLFTTRFAIRWGKL